MAGPRVQSKIVGVSRAQRVGCCLTIVMGSFNVVQALVSALTTWLRRYRRLAKDFD